MDIMKPAKPNAVAKPATKVPSQKAIIRAVASSTAIETGKSVRQIERTLRDSKTGRFRDITLAR